MTTPTSAQPTEVDQLTYEQARAELAQVVRQLEAGDAWLDQARARLEAATQSDQS